MKKSIVDHLASCALTVDDLYAVSGGAPGAGQKGMPGYYPSSTTTPAGSSHSSPWRPSTPLNFDGVSPGQGRAYDTFGFTSNTRDSKYDSNGTLYHDKGTQTYGSDGRRHSV